MIQINKLRGFEMVDDAYFVHKDGYVFSTFTKNGKRLKGGKAGRGYLNVQLKIKGLKKYKSAYIHRLVALAYIPNPENKEQVNHIDENKTNNCVDNLNWMTNRENNLHNDKNKRVGKTIMDKTELSIHETKPIRDDHFKVKLERRDEINTYKQYIRTFVERKNGKSFYTYKREEDTCQELTK